MAVEDEQVEGQQDDDQDPEGDPVPDGRLRRAGQRSAGPPCARRVIVGQCPRQNSDNA